MARTRDDTSQLPCSVGGGLSGSRTVVNRCVRTAVQLTGARNRGTGAGAYRTGPVFLTKWTTRGFVQRSGVWALSHSAGLQSLMLAVSQGNRAPRGRRGENSMTSERPPVAEARSRRIPARQSALGRGGLSVPKHYEMVAGRQDLWRRFAIHPGLDGVQAIGVCSREDGGPGDKR